MKAFRLSLQEDGRSLRILGRQALFHTAPSAEDVRRSPQDPYDVIPVYTKCMRLHEFETSGHSNP